MNRTTRVPVTLCFAAMLVMLAACEPRSAEYIAAEQTRTSAQATYDAAQSRYNAALATAEAAVQSEKDFMETVEREVGQLILFGVIGIGVLFVGGIVIVTVMSPFVRQELKRETDRLDQDVIPQLRLRNYRASIDLQLSLAQQMAASPTVSTVHTPPPGSVPMTPPPSAHMSHYTDETTAPYPGQQPRPHSYPPTPPAIQRSDDGGMTQPSKPWNIPEL